MNQQRWKASLKDASFWDDSFWAIGISSGAVLPSANAVSFCPLLSVHAFIWALVLGLSICCGFMDRVCNVCHFRHFPSDALACLGHKWVSAQHARQSTLSGAFRGWHLSLNHSVAAQRLLGLSSLFVFFSLPDRVKWIYESCNATYNSICM